MRTYCPKCASEVQAVFGRCKQCGQRVASPGLSRVSLEGAALLVGQIVSLLGCGASLIGLVWAVFWTIENFDGGDVIFSLVAIVLSSIVGFMYSLAMWVVFTRVRKLQ